MHETIHERVDRLKKRAAERYGIKPEQCHIGHLMLEGMLDKPMEVNQIDVATKTREANISLALRTMRLASAMHKFGLRPGDVVVVVARGHLDMSVPFYGGQYMGYSICCIDPINEESDFIRLYGAMKPKFIFTVQESLEKSNKALESNSLQAKVVVFDDSDNDLETFVQVHDGSAIDFSPAVDFNTAEVPAWLILTSGTTGPAKAAIIPYDHVLNAAIEWWDGDYHIKSMMVLTSPQWLTSLVYNMSAPIKGFLRIQSSQPISPQIIIHMINSYKPEFTAFTPFLLAKFVQGPRNICDLSCFRHILVGGAAIPRDIAQEFKQLCPARLHLAYGMTEVLVVIFNIDDYNIPFQSCGKAHSKYQYRLIDDNGEDITKPHENGELWVKGYGFFTGYMGDPEETKKVLTEDGWLKTGDIFYRDENDYYYYAERKRLLIRYFGFFISPLEVEEVIKKHPGVMEACVVGIPNLTTMELAVAAIMKKPGHDVNPQEIFDLVSESLPSKKHLYGGLFFVDTFPVTVSSKINRSKVLKMAKEIERIMPK